MVLYSVKFSVNLPRWGLKLQIISAKSFIITGVNLPRWGLKLPKNPCTAVDNFRVNLPRWGLKHSSREISILLKLGVNLPRWGLKPLTAASKVIFYNKCKFTPLGFETETELLALPFLLTV